MPDGIVDPSAEISSSQQIVCCTEKSSCVRLVVPSSNTTSCPFMNWMMFFGTTSRDSVLLLCASLVVIVRRSFRTGMPFVLFIRPSAGAADGLMEALGDGTAPLEVRGVPAAPLDGPSAPADARTEAGIHRCFFLERGDGKARPLRTGSRGAALAVH